MNNGIVSVGPGMGTDERINNPAKLAEVLNYLGDYQLSHAITQPQSLVWKKLPQSPPPPSPQVMRRSRKVAMKYRSVKTVKITHS